MVKKSVLFMSVCGITLTLGLDAKAGSEKNYQTQDGASVRRRALIQPTLGYYFPDLEPVIYKHRARTYAAQAEEERQKKERCRSGSQKQAYYQKVALD